MVDTKPLVIFVPGLYSSTLKSMSKSLGCLKKDWNLPKSLAQSLVLGNNGHSNLSLPITWSKDESGRYVQDKDDIVADDCLVFVQDKLLNVLDTLNDNDLIDLHKIVWDWRRSFEEAEENVSSKIESICANDERKAIILSHSTGAMLSWPSISRHPEWFSSWVNAAGCLLLGSNTFLGDFQHGWYKSFVKLISKEAFFSFAGIYSYFPVQGEVMGGGDDSDLVTTDGSFPKIDYFDIATWEKFKLGIFEWKSSVTDAERTHLKHALDTAKRFREKNLVLGGKANEPSALHKDPSEYDHLKITCYGTELVQTHSAYEVDLETNTIDVSKSKITKKGDGTLYTTNWQVVPGGLKRDIVMAEVGSDHVSLVNDKKLHDLLVREFFSGDELKKASAIGLLWKDKEL